MIEPGREYVLFDGDCGICTSASERAKRIDGKDRFVIVPYQTIPEPELARHRISYAECDRRLQVITGNGRVHAGPFAVNYFLWRQFPWSILVALMYALPVLLLFEVLAYAIVARNRRRISQWFGLKACLLHR